MPIAVYAKQRSQYGDVSTIPTPAYFYGLQDHEEIAVTIDQGKTLHVKIEGRTPADDEGQCRLFFELNGQPRLIRIPQAGAKASSKTLKQAEEGNPNHIPSPMPGCIDPAETAQVKLLMHKPQQVFSCPAPGVAAGGYKSQSSHQ